MVCSCSCGLWFWCFQTTLTFTLPFRKGNWVGKSQRYKWKQILYAKCVCLGHNVNILLYSICILSKKIYIYIYTYVGWLWIPDSKIVMIIYSWWVHPFFKILHVSVLSGSCSNHSPTYPPVYIFQTVKSLDNNSWLDRPCLFVFSASRNCLFRVPWRDDATRDAWVAVIKKLLMWSLQISAWLCSVIIAGSLDDPCFDWIISTFFFAVPRPPKQRHLQ